MKLKKLFHLLHFYRHFIFAPIFCRRKEIEVMPIIQTSKGLSGKNINYLDGKPELRLLKIKIPARIEAPIHAYLSPMLIHVTRERSKHVRV